MTLLPRVRRSAIATLVFVFALLMAPVLPTSAAQAVRPTHVAPQGSIQGFADSTAQPSHTAQLGHAPHQAAAIAGTTRSVNIAILGLGSLWIVLMVRRIQLRGAALRHAEVGH